MMNPLNMPDKCEWEGCESAPEALAATEAKTHEGEIPNVGVYRIGFYCREHARSVAKKHHPEYIEDCPNCGCFFGVN